MLFGICNPELRVNWICNPTSYATFSPLYAGGTRIKKTTRKSSGDKYITVYIDGIFEHSYHLDGSNAMDEELNELHVMDDQTRVAMLRTGYDDGTPTTKYILSDHLGSSNVILESNGSVYNREEFYPFGETSFGSFGKKRYRYVGKEKDEESGLYYYGARYFQPWSCRFISVDPLAAKYANLSPYNYADNTPVTDKDIDGMQNTTSDPTPTGQGQEVTLTDPNANPSMSNFVWSKAPINNGTPSNNFSDQKIEDLKNAALTFNQNNKKRNTQENLCLEFFVEGLSVLYNKPASSFNITDKMSTSLSPLLKNGNASQIKDGNQYGPNVLVSLENKNSPGTYLPAQPLTLGISFDSNNSYTTNQQGNRVLKPNNVLDANITQALFQFINSQQTPTQQFVFAIGPAMQWHSTFLIIDNKNPAKPIFYFVDNHGVKEFDSAKSVDKYYSAYTYSAWKKYTHDKNNPQKEVLRKGLPVQSFIYYLTPKK